MTYKPYIVHVDNYEQYLDVLKKTFRKIDKPDGYSSFGLGEGYKYGYNHDECICLQSDGQVGHATLSFFEEELEVRSHHYGDIYTYEEFIVMTNPLIDIEQDLDILEQKFK